MNLSEYKEFAQCKLCACEGLDKKFKHNNSTSNMTRHLDSAHNVTNENPTGKVSIYKLFYWTYYVLSIFTVSECYFYNQNLILFLLKQTDDSTLDKWITEGKKK